jgi:hypothetical protein
MKEKIVPEGVHIHPDIEVHSDVFIPITGIWSFFKWIKSKFFKKEN